MPRYMHVIGRCRSRTSTVCRFVERAKLQSPQSIFTYQTEKEQSLCDLIDPLQLWGEAISIVVPLLTPTSESLDDAFNLLILATLLQHCLPLDEFGSTFDECVDEVDLTLANPI